MNVQGINHITIKVSDLKKATHFYQEILGAKIVHKGNTDVYLDISGVWICLMEIQKAKPKQKNQIGVDHFAFSIVKEDFNKATEYLKEKQVTITRGPIERGGGWTINFLDRDGNELELYTGSLYERMKNWK
ncbi:VOC family protein [Fictibacillus phosphorivorans]|uniref:VOC family protein n=1 Tax=Fictibacillus phosphorivorans TaxID=1221500 RepID=UPI002040FBD6|nr:VOC family protein [Fictibacillus phosphorivorans]MCM3775273.1 VOC family protein [Fictibacillus phosphorivorans]